MNFHKDDYVVEKLTLAEETISFRAFRNRVYVDRPVSREFHQMNIFTPEAYYQGERINGYDIHTAPIFMPNMVGGYMPGGLGEPGYGAWEGNDKPNTIFRALQHGYVVAVPAVRGRVQKDEAGGYIGKAPACIVDYKAAVRYLRFFANEVPGDTEKMITNGTSAGGALSSLMGAAGNHSDYEPYLWEIGAAKARDDIFAASCYCPITNLEHGDMAYEWQFSGIYDYHRMHMQMEEGGRPVFVPEDGEMSPLQIKVSGELAKLFPEYVNSLRLKDKNGKVLVLDRNGNDSFKEHMENLVLKSAQKAMDAGIDISDKRWLERKDGKAVRMDWRAYVKEITRMKTAPAFDSLSLDSPENDLFGNRNLNLRHFTEYSKQNSLENGELAEDIVVKMMNPMHYIDDKEAVKAPHWRIRHGAWDRDTSSAISAMLALKLENAGLDVDYHLPWNMPHAGDYDLEELFAWIDEISKPA